MKRIFTTLIIIAASFAAKNLFAQTVYASITSGAWNSVTEWETFPTFAAAIAATPGTGTPTFTNPGGTHNVLIRNGHTVTMGDANRGCKGIIIQSGGKLWGSGNTQDRRLQIGQGGTGFVYPLVDTIQVDGVMGGPGDKMYIETGTAAQLVKLYGSGTVDILRIRTFGGSGASDVTTPGVMNFNIDINLNLWQTANYALTAVYNPTLTDNYTINLLAGRTVTTKAADGTFHNSQNTTYGRYTYNINGTLDVSANTTTTSSSIIAPNPATSKITLNIDGGTFKLGTNFNADTSQTSPTSLGVLDFKLVNGGIVDATNTTSFRVGKTSDGAGGFRDLVFAADATSSIKQTVGSVQVEFPVGLAGSITPNSAYLTNSGTADVFTVFLKGTIDNPPPTANVVNRQWTINEAVAGGTVGTVALSWVTADQAAGFDPAQTVSILRWTGTTYQIRLATVSGSGTANDPYVATASGFVAFSPFIVANLVPLPVSFESAKAYQKNAGIQVEWSSAQEINVSRYIIERSADGNSFFEAGFVYARGIASGSNYSWFDASPLPRNNFYRVKSVDVDGKTKSTSIMKVNIAAGKPSLIISPNPVKGNVLNLQLGNAAKGTYTLVLYNTAGQKMFKGEITSEGGSSSQSVKLPSSVKPGTYNLQLNNGDSKLNKTIVIE